MKLKGFTSDVEHEGISPIKKATDERGKSWYVKEPSSVDEAIIERLCYRLGKAIGLRVPETKIIKRGGSYNIASKSVFNTDKDAGSWSSSSISRKRLKRGDRLKVILFDTVLHNTDRHGGNYFVGGGGGNNNYKIYPIDHAFCFYGRYGRSSERREYDSIFEGHLLRKKDGTEEIEIFRNLAKILPTLSEFKKLVGKTLSEVDILPSEKEEITTELAQMYQEGLDFVGLG